MKRTLVITSEGFPPYVNTIAILMQNLFTFFPKQSYVVILNRPMKENIRVKRNQFSNHDYHYINANILKDYGIINKIAKLFILTVKVIKIIKSYKISNILVVPMDSNRYDVIAYVVSKIFNKPFYVYLFDIYSIPYTVRMGGMINNAIGKHFEPILLRSAKKVFVMSEYHGQYYEQKYGIKSVYLPNTVIINPLNKVRNNSLQPNSKEKKIVYAGMVYEAQLDALIKF